LTSIKSIWKKEYGYYDDSDDEDDVEKEKLMSRTEFTNLCLKGFSIESEKETIEFIESFERINSSQYFGF